MKFVSAEKSAEPKPGVPKAFLPKKKYTEKQVNFADIVMRENEKHGIMGRWNKKMQKVVNHDGTLTRGRKKP